MPAIAPFSILAFLPVAGAVWYARRALAAPAGVTLIQTSLLLALALLLSPLAGLDFNVFVHLNNSILYKQVAAQLKPEDRLVVFYDYRPALPFYTQRPYVSYQSNNELAFGMTAEPRRHGNVDTPEALREIVRQSPGRVFGLIDPGDLKQKAKAIACYFRPTAFPQTPDTVVVELKLTD
ncbi:MAG: hypothetical protein NTV49_14955 [Kiritimatiellaeota bacterium]|nr:hypothetical protein [Kiritimatiellota bacterium]